MAHMRCCFVNRAATKILCSKVFDLFLFQHMEFLFELKDEVIGVPISQLHLVAESFEVVQMLAHGVFPTY